MARLMLVVGFTAGVIVTTIAGAAVGLHADEASAEILEAAAAANVDPVNLQGAVNSTGLDPFVYLRGVGELPPQPATPPPAPVASGRVDCIVHYESQDDARAVNPRSGAAGLGQFTLSTWRSTPQGRAGLSVFDPSANRAAVGWMLSAGRSREFAVVTAGLC